MDKLKAIFGKMKANGCLAMLGFFISVTVIFILLKVFVF